MKTNKSFLKRRYYDVRLGGTMVSPLIQMANFIGIAFLWINHMIPIEIFGPLFGFFGFILLATVGMKFRKHQASTDYDLLFERQRAQAKTFYHIMLSQREIMIKNGIQPDKYFLSQLDYVHKIANDNLDQK